MIKYGLQFNAPAKDWLSAIPLGNGHIGVMLHGSPNKEILTLNDDTLWSGYKRDNTKPYFRENLDEVRRLMLLGKRFEAQEIIESKMLGRFTQVYLPLGNIEIELLENGEIVDYKRQLYFCDGLANVRYKKGNNDYEVNCFCSYPSDVMVYQIKASKTFAFTVALNSQLNSKVSITKNKSSMDGTAPSDIIIDDVYNFNCEGNVVSYQEAEKSIRFRAELRIVTDGVCSADNGLQINDCTYAELYYSSATTFKHKDINQYCNAILKNAIECGYDQLLLNHVSDFSKLYNRVQIELGGKEKATDAIYNNAKNGLIDGYDVATLFQYGRYLLISSSREGTQPANLQGIWNKDLIPPWWCNYTLNINLQMNYWHAERTNLSECVSPLLTILRD